MFFFVFFLSSFSLILIAKTFDPFLRFALWSMLTILKASSHVSSADKTMFPCSRVFTKETQNCNNGEEKSKALHSKLQFVNARFVHAATDTYLRHLDHLHLLAPGLPFIICHQFRAHILKSTESLSIRMCALPLLCSTCSKMWNIAAASHLGGIIKQHPLSVQSQSAMGH